MAPKKAKEVVEPTSLVSSDPTVAKPRLVKLIIKNFRCIGSNPVEIDLDDIVVLVGPNNAGKSSILKAYETVMSDGSNEVKLTIEDFPNNIIDSANLPEIEIHTIVFDKTPGEKWITTTPTGELLVKERWTWSDEGKPKRQGWDKEITDWSENVPWGAPNVANSRRPQPHRVDAFDSPAIQAEAIKKLLKQALEERVKTLKSSDDETNDYKKLLGNVKDLQKKIVSEAQTQIDSVNRE